MSDPNAPNAKNSLANAARYVHVTSSVSAQGTAVYVLIPVVSQFINNNRIFTNLRIFVKSAIIFFCSNTLT